MTGRAIIRTVAIGFSAALIALAVSNASAAGEPTASGHGLLTIGVRSMARPFSYKLPDRVVDTDATRGPLSHAGYGGYMVRICDAVLAEMLVPDPDRVPNLNLRDIKILDLDAQQGPGNVADDLSSQPSPVPAGGDAGHKPAERRFADLGTDFDILCDPATITNTQREFFVSPPLFLGGIGYLSLSGAAPPQDPCGVAGQATMAAGSAAEEVKQRLALIGLVKGTTAARQGIRALVEAREMPKYNKQLTAYLQGNEFGTCKDKRRLVIDYPDHQAAAEAFCLHDAFYYYVGDLEIIRTYAEAIPGCHFENGSATYTNDRYAIFGKAIAQKPPPSRPDPSETDRKLLVARFFEILSQKVVFFPSVLDKAYEDTFPGKLKSAKLQYFYWSIRGESRPDMVLFEQRGGSGSEPGTTKN